MKTRTKKILIAVMVLLIVVIGGMAIYHAYLRPEALRNMVQLALEAELQKKIVIKNFEIDVLNRPPGDTRKDYPERRRWRVFHGGG